MNNKKQQIKELLKIHYGFESFRKGQSDAIDSILAKKNTIVIMPTGGGKSLIYQLSALVLDGITIVISPLIALMKDQVDFLNSVGIPATFINSTISTEEYIKRINQIQNKYFKLLYVSPERFNNQSFIQLLKGIKVSLFAIDEAHCISQWGHDFRPSYTRLSKAVELVGNPPIVALTATATLEVKEDISRQLKLINPNVYVTGFARPNLQFGVISVNNDSEKMQAILNTIKSIPEPRGIIYAGTRKKTDEIMEILKQEGFKIGAYHAGMDIEKRKNIQESFMEDKIDIIVATNAFGLGIDKPNIRFVIHHDMPGTIEAYYQEAGRAGRDGKNSLCLLIYAPKDRYLREFFINGENPSLNTILEIYDTLLNYEEETVSFTYTELNNILSEKVPDMAIGSSLKLLEKNGLISKSREKSKKGYIKINKSLDELLEIIGNRAKVQRKNLKNLFELYEKELITGFKVNLDEIADIIDAKRATFKGLIKKISEAGACEYTPPFKGTEIKILKRIPVEELELSFNVTELQTKKEKAYDKLNKMENYVFHTNCRQKYILNYFGDTDDYKCGMCDNCAMGL